MRRRSMDVDISKGQKRRHGLEMGRVVGERNRRLSVCLCLDESDKHRGKDLFKLVTCLVPDYCRLQLGILGNLSGAVDHWLQLPMADKFTCQALVIYLGLSLRNPTSFSQESHPFLIQSPSFIRRPVHRVSKESSRSVKASGLSCESSQGFRRFVASTSTAPF
jgi:hypothetical protein